MNDSALEARADREGARAARGMSVTPGHGGASAAGPMQAKSGRKKKQKDSAESFADNYMRRADKKNRRRKNPTRMRRPGLEWG